MGFIEDIEEIFGHANPDSRILLFSATMPPQILKIASQFMGDYEVIEEEKRPEEPLLTEQRYWVVRENEKIEALVRLIDISPDFYGLVFTQTKVDADSVCKQLDEKGYEVAALHGDIPQAQREKILYRFRNKKTRILVATDVAARGIDIEGLTHVVNYALPFDVPTYVHRIGRTGRAGAKGLAFTFVRPEERRKLEFIKQAAFKSTKGKLTEEEIPSVKEVLKIKEKKLFEQMQEQLSLFKTEEDPSSEENENSAETQIENKTENKTEGKKENQTFAKMAQILCEERDPMEVLSEVLALSYGKSLDPKRYGEITPLKVFNQGRQIRLYVQMGRKDGYSPKDIANYFSKLLKIPQRMVDRIDLSEKFVLVSLPYQAGMDLVARAKKDKSLPSMHVDSKESQSIYKSEKSGRKGKFSDSSRGSKNSGRSSGRKSENRGNHREDGKRRDKSNSGSRKKSGFSGNREGGSKPIHTNKTSNASLYKK